MKKSLPIILVTAIIAVILVVGARSFLKGGETGKQESGIQKVTTTEEKSFTGKLKDALTRGLSMKCTWEKDKTNFSTAYIKDKKIYTEATYSGKKMYSILADNCVHSWEENKNQGIKICFEPKDNQITPEEFTKEAPDFDYNCVPTIISDSMFNPPSNVKFLNPQELIRP